MVSLLKTDTYLDGYYSAWFHLEVVKLSQHVRGGVTQLDLHRCNVQEVGQTRSNFPGT